MVAEARSAAQARLGVEALLSCLGSGLEPARGPILLHADLRAGLPGVGGASTDLRLIAAVVGALRAAGHRDLILGDGLAIPAEGPAPSLYRRSRVDRLARGLGVGLVDLSRGEMETVSLRGGRFRVSSLALRGVVVALPTVAIDRELGLRAALSLLVGAVHPEDRRRLMERGSQNLPDLARALAPAVTIADALAVREGEAPPADLAPRRIDRIIASADPLLLDLFLGRIFGLTPEEIPPLWAAIGDGLISQAAFAALEEQVGVAFDLRKPLPPWRDGLRRAPPPAAGRRLLPQAARDAAEDTLGSLLRDPGRCGPCRRCEEFCPVELTREQIGLLPRADACVECLYCYLVCPQGALSLKGDAGPLKGYLDKEKAALEAL